MTDSATISSLVQFSGRPIPGAPRVRPDSIHPPERRSPDGPRRSPSKAESNAALPAPLLSGETRLASQQAGAPSAEPRTATASAGTEALTEEEKKKVQELQSRDREVRAHEQAHKAAGGPHAGSPTFKTVRGPDGRSYAVSGEVKIDTSAVPNNPDATIRKMEQIKRAALAPSNPSSADRQVAAEADAKIQNARLEKREMEAEEREKAAGAGAAPGAIDRTINKAARGARHNLVA